MRMRRRNVLGRVLGRFGSRRGFRRRPAFSGGNGKKRGRALATAGASACAASILEWLGLWGWAAEAWGSSAIRPVGYAHYKFIQMMEAVLTVIGWSLLVMVLIAVLWAVRRRMDATDCHRDLPAFLKAGAAVPPASKSGKEK